MKLDFNFNITRSNGEEIEGAKASGIIADALEMSQAGDYNKYISWAEDLQSSGTLDIDKHNKQELRGLVEKSGLRAIVKKRIIDYIDSVNGKGDG